MGTGWAPFRGGPLRHADSIGTTEIVRRLETLTREIAPHFEPAPRLVELARAGRRFYSARPAVPAEEHRPMTDIPLKRDRGILAAS
jgi:3-hydroxyacyl-CoA dehydrogenase/enoyl-CoA hydratase/3-hydroxybutyryl-CoA epimerase